MRKIAVVFPGIGYTKDRPLLYYSGKHAVSRGFELIHIDFKGLDWSKEKLKDMSFLMQTMKKCMQITEDALCDLGDLSKDKVVFISKSIGTVAATAFACKRSISAYHICFSPLVMIRDYISSRSGILFYGDNDPLADHNEIEKIAKEKRLETFKVSGGNHSLETGDVQVDIDNLKAMMCRVSDIF